ncbi:MAG: FtsX-like permease family protein [Acidimicrobiales bacterium]
MIQTTLRGLWSHKRRLISTCIAVLLGVAFMAGTLVLSATVNRVFDDLFDQLGENVDAIVRGPELFESQFTGTQRGLLDDSVVAKVAAVDGVAGAEGSIQTVQLTLLDSKGDPVGGGFGPPTIVTTWNSDEAMASYQVADGRAPTKDGEAIIDRATAEDAGLEIGKPITLVGPKGKVKLELVGTSKFGSADSAGGATSIGTTLAQSQELVGEPGKVDTISVRAEPGVTPEQLVQRLDAAKLAPKYDVVTGQQAADEQASDIKSGFGFFSTMLMVFAFIALFVGWFIISNTFNILVAQRTRELALMRAIGATRRQVLGSVMLEASVIGIVSATLGFLSGVLLSKAALVGLNAAGLSLPQAGLVITPSIAVRSILAGLVITAIAAIGPAVKATRVPPMAALRDVAIDRTGASKVRIAVGLLFLVLGVLAILPAFQPDPTSDKVPGVGAGLFLIVLAVLFSGPVVARPVARIVGLPIPWIKGVTGQISRQNAMRSPRRTASTAAALTIGVALVAFITIFASSVQTSVNDSIGSGFKGDYIVSPVNQFSFGGVSPKLGDQLAAIDGVETVTAINIVPGQLVLPNGSKPTDVLGGVDPATFDQVFEAQMASGSIADLTDGGIVIDKTVAKQEGLSVGDKVKVTAQSGRKRDFTVEAISDDPALLGRWTVTRDAVTALSPEPSDYQLGLKAASGTDPATLRAPIKKVLKAYPTMKVQDRDQFTNSIVKTISTLLNVIYGLLLVSIVIAVIGIANTLSLSIHERTRELGLLRAMGMSRAQLRSSVRWEAVIVAAMGTVVGTALGLVLSYTMVKVLVSQGITTFAVPVGGVVLVVVFGAALGVAASLWPAYKASKLNVLDAIATE